MNDFSNLTGKFRLDSLTSKVTRRPRESLVCNQCRRSKLRCDRGQPCSSCVKRDEAASCSYQRSPGSRNVSSRSAVAEDRLMHLEDMVTQLIQKPASTILNDVALFAGKPNTPPILPHDPAGSAQPERTDEGRYVGSTHWSAILDDIHELKAVLGVPLAEENNDDPVALDAPVITDDIIFGDSTNYSLTNILTQYLPPRIEVDRAISLYFRGETFIVPFIHTYQFQRQYQAFWADISNVNPLWLSSLFSLCYIATLIGSATSADQLPQEELISRKLRLHTAAAQCLVLGKYHRPQPFAVEALALYGHCKNLRSLDPCREAGDNSRSGCSHGIRNGLSSRSRPGWILLCV